MRISLRMISIYDGRFAIRCLIVGVHSLLAIGLANYRTTQLSTYSTIGLLASRYDLKIITAASSSM